MPYIEPERRTNLDEMIHALSARIVRPGELNYTITKLIHKHVTWHGKVTYDILNEVVGVLEGVKQEFYRKVMVPFEDEKIRINGDIDGDIYAPTLKT